MIHFKLICDQGHEFDGWFQNNQDFDKQKNAHLLNCPLCNSEKVEKALMAPAIRHKSNIVGQGLNDYQKQIIAKIHNFTRQIRANSEYVGEQFSQEARKIHFGETKKRSIYGQASQDEVVSLLEDGIDVLPLPELPEDKN